MPEISGAETICNNSVTTCVLSNGGNSVTWSVSSNLTIQSQNLNSITVRPTSTSTNGAGFIEAVLPTQTIRKNIWIGKPLITVELEPMGTNYVAVHMVGLNNTNINKQSITSTTWQKISSSGGCYASFGGSGFEGLGHGNCNSWSVYAKITATNSCGKTTIYRTITPPTPDPCDDYYRISNTYKNTYEVMRIIDPCARTLGNQKLSSLLGKEKIQIQVFDIYGNQMMETQQKNINNLKNGLYIILVSINDKILTSRIIKQ